MSLRVHFARKNLLKLVAIATVILSLSLTAQMIVISRISSIAELVASAKPTYRCNFTNETKSALKRVKSKSCRNEIENLACRLAEGNYFPLSLPHFCPRSEAISYGCYADADDRFLKGALFELPGINSVQSCIGRCFRLGFKLAGVESGIECHCSNELGKNKISANITECHNKCPANESEFCGGHWRILVFSTGIKEINRTFVTPSYTSTETSKSTSLEQTNDVRIVFHFSFSGRFLRQILRLLKHMYNPRHYYIFHIDKRDEYLFRELSKLESQVDNIKFKKKRFASIWGGSSHLIQMLESVREIFELYSNWKWDFLINLSESHFPLFPISQLEAFLTANRQWNFAEGHYINGNTFVHKTGLEWAFVECDKHLWRLAQRQIPDNIRIQGNSDWFALTREFLHYITYSEDDLVKGLTLYHSHAVSAPETFYQTLLVNSRFCHTFAHKNLQFVSWGKPGSACECKKEVDWCGCSPLAITTEWAANFNYDKLKRNHQYIARKFDPTVDLGAINIVERNFLNWTHKGNFNANVYFESSYKSFWFNDFHYLDKNTKTDLAKLSLLHSLLYISINQFAMRRFKILAATVEELTILLYEGQEFLLLKYSANTTFGHVQLETKFQYKPNVTSLNTDNRIKSTEVGTNWDIKIENFRNYAKSFGSTSTLGLRVVTNCTEELHLKSVWYNPSAIEQGVVVHNTTNKTNTWLLDWSVNKHQKPGHWYVDLEVDGIFTTQLKFAVLPNKRTNYLTYRNGEEIDKLSKNLVNNFYVLLDNCIVDKRETKAKRLVQTCRNAQWSSLSPDPKSSFSITSS